MTQSTEQPLQASQPIGLQSVQKATTIQFSGVLDRWLREIQEEMEGSRSLVDVASLAIELLHSAIGKEIVLEDGSDRQVVNIAWRSQR
jgi:hypothetical protein